MKVLQIIQRPQLRGAEIFACQLSEALIERGHAVDVLVLFGEQSDVFPYKLTFFYLAANERKRMWDIDAYRRLNKLVQDNRYDIVQANAGDTLKYASISRFLFGWKAKLVFRNANKMSDFLGSPVKLQLNKWFVKQVDFVASVSEECKLDFADLFPFTKSKLAALPIGVSTAYKPLQSPLAALGVNDNAPVLLSVAGFAKEKNHEGLLRIFCNVLLQYPKAQLLLVGEGKLAEQVKSQVDELGLSSAVFFAGRRQDVPAIMQYCSVLAMPSLIEGLPAVILESFLQRLPVVAYAVGGIPEVVIPQQTGFLVAKNDEEGFLNAVLSILRSSEEDMKAIKDNASRLVASHYDNNTIAGKFEAAYQRLLCNT